MAGSKILVVEDSKEIFQMIKSSLINPLLELDWVTSISEARESLNKNDYDLMLLDIGLPESFQYFFLRPMMSYQKK